MVSLTKENFWNELQSRFPSEMKQFCTWIDAYKKRAEWDVLFTAGTKYHDLPIAIQIGIFMQYVAESENRFGIEIPHIEDERDFEKIPDLIKDFFFHENDNAMTNRDLGTESNDILLGDEEEDFREEDHY